jgi:hypothetical protein
MGNETAYDERHEQGEDDATNPDHGIQFTSV